MRWEDESSLNGQVPDSLIARYKVREAFDEGFLSWYSFTRALAAIDRVNNGSWMFKNGVDPNAGVAPPNLYP